MKLLVVEGGEGVGVGPAPVVVENVVQVVAVWCQTCRADAENTNRPEGRIASPAH